jgi:nitronate monooxygenase
VREYGGMVIADVVNLTLARKAVAAGVDGLACICAGAGGHTGSLSPFAFVRAVRGFYDGLVVLGGGICDGFGVAGALAAGADLVYMGTRFIASTESLASEGYKQMVVDCDVDDLIVSASITGTPASWLKPSLLAYGLDPQNLPPPPQRNYDANRPFSARRWLDTWSAGQGIGSIRAVAPIGDIVADIERDFRQATTRFTRAYGARADVSARSD